MNKEEIVKLREDTINCDDENIVRLVRKMYVIASDLGIDRVKDTMLKELNGYGIDDNIPIYRQANVVVQSNDGFQGDLHRIANKYSDKKSVVGIADGIRILTLHSENESKLFNMDTSKSIIIDKSEFIGILDRIRNLILEITNTLISGYGEDEEITDENSASIKKAFKKFSLKLNIGVAKANLQWGDLVEK